VQVNVNNMVRIQVLKNFYLDEFIDKKTYLKYEAKGELWKLRLCIDNRVFDGVQLLRDMLGVPLTINNWSTCGDRNWSGLRTENSPYYSKTSQHSYGRAVDIISGLGGELMRKFIDKHWVDFRKYFTTVEGNVEWLHIDCRIVDNNNKINIV